ncbi:MAG TPA: adenine deaminase [Syntrophales bacterium]|nr:adenine deaminase [Syntrophales bacterium]
MLELEKLQQRLRAARGEVPADLVIRGGRVLDVFTQEIVETDVAVSGGRIVGLGRYEGREVFDAAGRFVSPGFIDGHFHVESSMLSPPELARAVLSHGTTAIVADPHEIANVMGVEGIRYMLRASRGLAVDFFFMLPSCVPATPLETSGAALSAADLAVFREEERVLGLAEMMNYPGVAAGSPDVLEKILLFSDRVCDGHAPLLSGKALNAYLTAGIRSDHECTNLAEAQEKLRAGMHILIREGTQAKNLADLMPLVTPVTLPRCSLVTDDLHPHDLLEKGHLDFLLGRACESGISPLQAICMVTINTAQYFRLHDRGAVAPGRRADLAILSSLQPVRVEAVIKDGRIVCDGKGLCWEAPPVPEGTAAAMNIRPFSIEALSVSERGGNIRVIGMIPDQILTEARLLRPTIAGGRVAADPGRDLAKIAVVERHRGTGNIGLGFVQGFGLREGALASSVAHDSHNVICAGVSDADMMAAVKAVEGMGGGLAVVRKGAVLAEMPLPIAGLVSDRPLAAVAAGWRKMREASRALGCSLREPFMALSFLALPVIPALKITDRGLVDVDRFSLVPLFEGAAEMR